VTVDPITCYGAVQIVISVNMRYAGSNIRVGHSGPIKMLGSTFYYLARTGHTKKDNMAGYSHPKVMN